MAYTKDQLYDALRKADAAGDADSSRAIIAAINQTTGTDEGLSGTVTDKGPPKPVVPAQDAWTTFTNSAQNMMSGGIMNKVAAAGASPFIAGIDALRGHPTSLGDEYSKILAQQNGQDASNSAAHPIASGFGSAAGALASPIGEVGGAVSAARGLEGMHAAVNSGLVGGAVYGGLYGAGQSQAPTWGGVAQDAASGAAVGATGGMVAAPLISGAVRAGGAVAGAVGRLTGDGSGTGADLVASRLAQDHVSPQDAASLLQAGQDNGVPTAMADLGPNSQMLAGSLSRQPGAARDMAVNFTRDRQLGQTERLQDAISRDLGPTVDTFAESDRLIDQARKAAAPLYDKAYANPIPDSEKLQSLVGRPSMRSAMARAYSIAAEEGRDPKVMGFNLDGEGNVTLEKHNSTQTWDYVKRGIDDVLEAKRSPLTGKLVLDEQGRAINATKQQLLGELDRLNPDYGAARQAYAGPASLKSAMMDGQKALGQSANQINQRLQNMSDGERQQFALGFRSALSEKLNTTRDGANSVTQLIGTPAKRQALQRVFGADSDVGRLLDTLGQENAANQTYGRVSSGSMTAANMAEDSANADGNLLSTVGKGAQALAGGKQGLAKAAITGAQNAFTFGVGKAGQRAREEAASMLFTTSPNDFLSALVKAQGANAARQGTVNALAQRGIKAAANLAGGSNSLAVQHNTP